MTIFYSCGDNRKLELSINEKITEIGNLNAGGADKINTVTVPVNLIPGDNIVRMGNNFGWAPDIDRFTLQKK